MAGRRRPARLRIAAVLAAGAGGDAVFVTAANAPGTAVDRIDVGLAPGTDRAGAARALRAATGAPSAPPTPGRRRSIRGRVRRPASGCSSSSASRSSTRPSAWRAPC
ncbi:hypothetical protein ACFQ60_27415 [Streptomyces zhihengii]